jgi:hypothetical protein
MKALIVAIFIATSNVTVLFSGSDVIADPIRAYVAFHSLSSGRIVYKWEIDLNGDGRKELLLATRLTPAELEQEEKESNWNPQTPNERDFTVYIPTRNLSGYLESKRADNENLIAVMCVDITRCFVGIIVQLNKRGFVTVDIQPAGRRNPAVATVYAYTLEGDHLRVDVLGRYDPDKGGNEVYDQYLSDSKRTKVKLEEIAP